MSKKSITVVFFTMFCLFSVSTLFAQNRQPEDVVKKVRELATSISKAQNSVEDIKWKWGKKGNYAFLINCSNMKMIKHPVKPKLEGQDLSNLQDKTGSYFFLEYCAMADKSPEIGGWVEYWWPKPGEDEPSKKISYVYAVPGESNKVVCSGIYTEKYTQEELNQKLKE